MDGLENFARFVQGMTGLLMLSGAIYTCTVQGSIWVVACSWTRFISP